MSHARWTALHPADDLLMSFEPEEAAEAVRRWVLAHPLHVPWGRIMSPWRPEDPGHGWRRDAYGGGYVRVYETAGRWYHSYTGGNVGWASRNEAMAAADRAVAVNQAHPYLHDGVIPPEEPEGLAVTATNTAPEEGENDVPVTPRPPPTPEAERELRRRLRARIAEGRRERGLPLHHEWATHQRLDHDQVVERCTRCNRLRCSGALFGLAPRWRHFASTDLLNAALRGHGTGLREAGPCGGAP